MVEKKTQAEAAESKVKAPKKAPAIKSEAKASAPKAPVREKKVAPKSGGTLTLKQTGSPIGRQDYQRATLIGLGLNKMGRTRTLEDTPSVRGMIAKVKHLVEIVK